MADCCFLLALAPAVAPPSMAQVTYTVVAQPDQGFGPIDTTAPSTPPETIIQQFAATKGETEFRRALDNYVVSAALTSGVQTG